MRLMSIHKSKGLEFPIVILADLDHAFSRQDFDTPVLVHPDMGLGPSASTWSGKSSIPPWPGWPFRKSCGGRT